MKNVPYKKQVNEDGKVINAITKDKPYISQAPNRKQRKNKQPRFIGNNKGVHLTVSQTQPPVKFRRIVQIIGKKRIERYQ